MKIPYIINWTTLFTTLRFFLGGSRSLPHINYSTCILQSVASYMYTVVHAYLSRKPRATCRFSVTTGRLSVMRILRIQQHNRNPHTHKQTHQNLLNNKKQRQINVVLPGYHHLQRPGSTSYILSFSDRSTALDYVPADFGLEFLCGFLPLPAGLQVGLSFHLVVSFWIIGIRQKLQSHWLFCNYRLGTRAINNWKRFQDVFLNTLTCPTLHVNFLRLQISRFFGSKIEHVPKKSPIYVEVFIRYIHPPEKTKHDSPTATSI